MCLAIPGRVVRWVDTDPISGVAEVEFGGVRRECHMACVPEAMVGDFVIVHAGVALSIIDSSEADRVLAELASLPDEEDNSETGEAGSAGADR
jgi:hydrogenase expression/formation protein HypC